MQLSKWKKVVLGLIATVLLGAVGSGFWEIGLKPFGQWLGRSLLTVATLGSNAVRDDIYREAAKGLHEASALQLYWLIVLGTLLTFSFLMGTITGPRGARKFRHNLGPLGDREKLPLIEKRLDSLRRQLYIAQLIFAVLFLMFLSIQFVDYLKVSQANAACTFFEQSMAICRPYLDDQQTRILTSRFASVNGRDDYIGIVTDLRGIASSHNRRLPDFTPW